MKSLVARCASAVLAIATPAAHAAPVPPAHVAELQLRALNHRFVSASGQPDRAFVESLAADDFRMIGVNGARVDRETFVALFSSPGGATQPSYDDVRVRLFGRVALVHGVYEALDAARRPMRVRYTDVFVWDGGHWRLVGAQNTALRDGVGKALARGAAPPATAAWAGEDPAGDDLEVLRQLNARYVQAFRESDVAWYDAHLAPDYVVTQGDGSFVDRAGALAHFARPTFAEHFRDFPVGEVNIRRFGDVALIEAENAYEMKDGRRGISRYVDVWHLAGGRWTCVSAHITVFQPPR